MQPPAASCWWTEWQLHNNTRLLRSDCSPETGASPAQPAQPSPAQPRDGLLSDSRQLVNNGPRGAAEQLFSVASFYPFPVCWMFKSYSIKHHLLALSIVYYLYLSINLPWYRFYLLLQSNFNKRSMYHLYSNLKLYYNNVSAIHKVNFWSMTGFFFNLILQIITHK